MGIFVWCKELFLKLLFELLAELLVSLGLHSRCLGAGDDLVFFLFLDARQCFSLLDFFHLALKHFYLLLRFFLRDRLDTALLCFLLVGLSLSLLLCLLDAASCDLFLCFVECPLPLLRF